MVKDPVCGMNVDETKAKYSSVSPGKTDYFCSAGCKSRFDADPLRFTRSGAESPHAGHGSGPAALETGGSGFFCPMHPHVRSGGPGTCPECGMRLEPAGGRAGRRFPCRARLQETFLLLDRPDHPAPAPLPHDPGLAGAGRDPAVRGRLLRPVRAFDDRFLLWRHAVSPGTLLRSEGKKARDDGVDRPGNRCGVLL